jgi:type II secretory pathway pseudopilin PulG
MRIHWVFLVVMMVVSVLGGAASYTVFQSQKDQLIEAASVDLADATAVFIQALNGVFEPALAIGATIETSGITRATGAQREDLFFALTVGKIVRYEQISGAFIGFPDGQFLHAQDLSIDTLDGGGDVAATGRVIDTPATDQRGRWMRYDGQGAI